VIVPSSAPRACTVSGCAALSCADDNCLNKRQATHRPKQATDPQDRGNLSRTTAYGQRRWLRLRDKQKSRHPLCQRCLSFDIVTPAKDVDHYIPHRGDPKLMWDIGNLQSLCKSCHSWKTQEELKGTYHDYRNYVS
jgi:5-methylcytosine-specific restriction protein A